MNIFGRPICVPTRVWLGTCRPAYPQPGAIQSAKMGDGTAGQRWDAVRVMTLLPIFDVHEIAEGVHST